MPISLDDFVIGDKIGKGRFGHVFKISRKDNLSKVFALKIMMKEELQQNKIYQQLLKEVEIQKAVKHKNVIRLVGASQDSKRVHLYLEYAENGTLYQFLKRLGKFPEDISVKYLRQLLNALTYLHAKTIVHRDIKPENLLISANGNLKLADFGWCTEIDADVGRMTVCGTPEYLPPEMINHQLYSDAVDSWTCGVLSFEFLSGRSPFVGFSDHETYSNILRGHYECTPDFSLGAKAFLEKSLQIDPSRRHNAGELFLDPWIQSFSEEGRTILDYEQDVSKCQTQVILKQHHDTSVVVPTISASDDKENVVNENMPVDSDCTYGKVTAESQEASGLVEKHIDTADQSAPAPAENQLPAHLPESIAEGIISLESLKINHATFDPNDAAKRPKGWEEAKQQRLRHREEVDRRAGKPEFEISQQHAATEAEIEEEMTKEAKVINRIRLFSHRKTAPAPPNTFHSVLSTHQANASIAQRRAAAVSRVLGPRASAALVASSAVKIDTVTSVAGLASRMR